MEDQQAKEFDPTAAIAAADEAIQAINRFIDALGEDWINKHPAKHILLNKSKDSVQYLKYLLQDLSKYPAYLSEEYDAHKYDDNLDRRVYRDLSKTNTDNIWHPVPGFSLTQDPQNQEASPQDPITNYEVTSFSTGRVSWSVASVDDINADSLASFNEPLQLNRFYNLGNVDLSREPSQQVDLPRQIWQEAKSNSENSSDSSNT